MILTTTYFGSVNWYAQLARATEPVYIDPCERFVKQTERSRCRIATANGVQTLSVPVTKQPQPIPNHQHLTPNHQHPSPITHHPSPTTPTISDHANWRHQHWNALCSAYGESPFFDYYADDIKPFFEPNWTNLYDFNYDIMKKLCELLDIPAPIFAAPSTEDVQHLSALSQEKDDNLLAFSVSPYYQTFAKKHGFIADLSVLDLLFNEGNESILYLLGRK